ncbi:DNA-binding response regulator [Alicyclobacillus contaminans]|uniref:response regulator transcription factor n=1 Tax=Alicyclobacillus contaminans TaxID=392016 RepID=UPI0003F8C100|nr:response regulator transcription factor [Alicyclobacillus contaminans]GMA49913.1 DNA-binding response regulator [Alicyclobacillus contaminans]
MSEWFQPSDHRILVVDDDPNIVDLIRLYLENKGYRVVCAYSGTDGLARLEQGDVHLIILDILMPDMDGWTLCQRVREQGDIPILMVTAKGEGSDKLKGFGLGADDYLVKPFDPNELVARATSLLRRTYHARIDVPPKTELRFGRLRIDTAGHTVTADGRPVDLTAREYQLLRIFVQNPNRILSRQQLLDLVWGIDYMGEDRVVDVFVKRVRQKLGPGDEDWAIVTVRGLGYKFETKG